MRGTCHLVLCIYRDNKVLNIKDIHLHITTFLAGYMHDVCMYVCV